MNEIFPLLLNTFRIIWGNTNTCEDSNKTFDVVKLGNMLRNRKYYLMDQQLISNKCFPTDNCSLDTKVACNIFELLSKSTNSLGLKAYVEHLNGTIFRIISLFNDTRIFGTEYKIFSPGNTPLLYEHQCLTKESILIKNVHKVVLQGHDISARTAKTGKCGIFLIKYMSDQLKHMLQAVTPDVINNTTSSILDFFFTTVTENTSLNYTNEVIDYNSTNSTDISNYDEQHSQDSTMLVGGLVLASTVSITYLLTCMYNKYCKKTPVAQTETADVNISDPALIEINSRKAKIYYSDSSSADGTEYAIVAVSSKRAKYTKATCDTSNPSSSHSDGHERMELMSSTDSSTQGGSHANSHGLVQVHTEDGDSGIPIDGSHADSHRLVQVHTEDGDSGIPIDGSHADSHRLVQVHTEDGDSGIPIDGSHANSHGLVQVHTEDGDSGIPIDGSHADSHRLVQVHTEDGDSGIPIDGSHADSHRLVQVHTEDGDSGIPIDGSHADSHGLVQVHTEDGDSGIPIDGSHADSHRLVQVHTEDGGSGIPIYDNYSPVYDYPQLIPPRLVVYTPIAQHHDDSSILGLSESLC
ncbi:hypothetical protein RMB_07445 (plasmid) [Rickettsia massiliae str. AZT80]|uniref:Uncharacterized protein n=2 Tax=Rickettsia massiliae TaxID=35791 RepID=H6QLC2_RICMA|nr:hypothetical protein RMB_07445 [Rickettsia massiliae str. AZT80]